ncbi:unnamed protein product, partial [Ectocarpus fasciculatus]
PFRLTPFDYYYFLSLSVVDGHLSDASGAHRGNHQFPQQRCCRLSACLYPRIQSSENTDPHEKIIKIKRGRWGPGPIEHPHHFLALIVRPPHRRRHQHHCLHRLGAKAGPIRSWGWSKTLPNKPNPSPIPNFKTFRTTAMTAVTHTVP